jgi:cytochrome c oxidase subunit 2
LNILHRFWLSADIPLSGLLVALTPSLAGADHGTNPPTPVARISRDTLYMHNDFMIIVTALFVVVFGIMIYTMVKHRQSTSYQAAKFAGLTGNVQWLWAMVPFAILLFVDYALMGMN